METLWQLTGDTMPDDIRERVDDGYMDEDAGRELARASGPTGCGRRMSAYKSNRYKRKAHSIWSL